MATWPKPSLMLAQQVLLFVTAASIAFATFDRSLFSWHPFCMSLGYVFLMGEGILSAVHFRSLDGSDRVRGIQAHALMQCRSLALIAVGAGTIIANKFMHGKHHFRSLHAKVGLAALVMSVLVPLGGAVAFRSLGLIHRFPERWHAAIKRTHRLAGVLTWLLSILAIQLALPHKAVHQAILTPIWQVATATAAVLMLVLLRKQSSVPSTAVLKAV